MDEVITISKARFDELEKAEFELNCLHAGGVNNWDWYSDSLKDGGYFDKYLS